MYDYAIMPGRGLNMYNAFEISCSWTYLASVNLGSFTEVDMDPTTITLIIIMVIESLIYIVLVVY